ncbi:DHCW motif cupin fold protein [Nocardia sp. NPDC052566]|uniref:DHCW motif cupin fold protein n=1 Tax=Nocardia sp. NPDC052566 TaxID=3364330 RepID=UPI0037CAAC8D
MKMNGFAFTETDWSSIPAEAHPGDVGEALWRTLTFGDIRVRRVDYSVGYEADHWCRKGHILFVLEGELVTTLDDGRTVITHAGNSYQVSDDAEAHRSSAPRGAKLLIVD